MALYREILDRRNVASAGTFPHAVNSILWPFGTISLSCGPGMQLVRPAHDNRRKQNEMEQDEGGFVSASHPAPSLISILSWGGIGDTIRNISLIPHETLFRRFGIRSRVFYMHWSRTDFNVSTGPPNPSWFEDLVSRCPSLLWKGEVQEYGGPGRYVNLALRRGIRLLDGGPRYFPFVPTLTEHERAALPEPARGARVAVQTHLSGMKTKQWGPENWKRYLRDLLAAEPALEIFLFDSDKRVVDLCIDERIQTTHGFNIPQSIVLLQRCDLLVSIDSWTKYVAAAHHIPQVLIIPDQRAEYPQLTPEKLLGDELAGIYGRADTEVIGLSVGPPATLTLPTLTELAPEELLTRTKLRLNALRTSTR